jgi:hypothetical protein
MHLTLTCEMSDVWFPNYPAYFGEPKNGDDCMLSDVLHIEKQQGYVAEIMIRRYMSQKQDNA